MKNLLATLSLFLLIFAAAITKGQAQIKDKMLLGEWTYEVADAPPDYTQGAIIFAEKNGKLVCSIKTSEGELSISDLKIANDIITFSTSIDGNPISVELKRNDNKLAGKVDTPMGAINVTATKKESFNTANKLFMGEWAYEVADVPYGYDKGILSFTEKDGKIICTIKLEGGDLSVSDLKIANDIISFGTSVEGNPIGVELKVENDKLNGTVDSPMGQKTFSATKK